ncbi:MAG: hypothetical protein IT428_03295 [Planctomycetaceae bacterium]|nr:hypothetical protein [Planctomycetaceae bacterium]
MQEARFYGVANDSKALTRRGWLHVSEIRLGDEVLGFDSGVLRWTPVRLVGWHPQLPLVRIHNENFFEALCTPGQRWIGHCRRGGTRTRRIVQEVFSTQSVKKEHSIYLSAPVEDERMLPITPAEAALIGFTYGDGSMNRSEYTGAPSQAFGRRVGFRVQIFQKKLFGVRFLESMISQWGRDVTRYIRPTGIEVFYLQPDDARSLWYRAGLYFEEDLTQFVLKLGTRCRKAFLEGAFVAEGSFDRRKIRHYAQNQGAFAEAIRLAIFMAGKFPSHSLKHDGDKSEKTCYVLREGKPYVTGQRMQFWPQKQLGAVWNLTNDLGSWVVKQGDCIFLTGDGSVPLGTGSETSLGAYRNVKGHQVHRPTYAITQF